MKKITVDYKRHFDKNGTCYDQTITLSKDFIKYINKLIRYYHNSSDEVKNITCETTGISRYNDFYLEELPQKENIIYLSLTQLKFIYHHLAINTYDIKRIKYRNTRIRVATNEQNN